MADDDTISELLDLELADPPADDDVPTPPAVPDRPLSIDEFIADLDLTAAPEPDDDDTDAESADASSEDDVGADDDRPDPLDETLDDTTGAADEADADDADDPDADDPDEAEAEGDEQPADEDEVGADGSVDGEDLLVLVDQAVESARLRAETVDTVDVPEPTTVDAIAEVATPAPPPATVVDPFRSTAMGTETASGLLLQYPSRDFPPPPVVRLEVPTGWLGTAAPDAEMAARAPEAVDGVYPNVVMRVRRVSATMARDADLRVLMTIDGGDDDDDVEIVLDEVRADATAPARRLLVRRRGPAGTTVLARHLLVLVPATDHVASIVSIVATWPESADDDLGDTLTAVLSSVRVFMPQRNR